MSDGTNDNLPYRAFTLGVEIASHLFGSQPHDYFRCIEFLQALAAGEETLLESPTDTASQLLQLESERDFITNNLGEQAFKNMKSHCESKLRSSFAKDREDEIDLAKALLKSRGDKDPPVS